jgi:hypothetical protein
VKAIVYWPDRLSAKRTQTFGHVVACRMMNTVGGGGYSVTTQEPGKPQAFHDCHTTDAYEVVLLPDGEDDHGEY